MPAPAPEAIQQSLTNLRKGLSLPRKDFFNVARFFSFEADQDRFLQETHASNQQLADTLVIFRKKLSEAAANNEDLEPVIDRALLHYIINTDGRVPESEDIDPFDVTEAVIRYAEAINVRVNKKEDGALLIQVDKKEDPFPEWAPTPGWSAARMLRQLGPVINRVRYGRDAVIPSVAFGFDAQAEGHTLANAMTLADCSQLAYFGSPYVEKQLKQWGYTAFRWIEAKKTDTQAFLAGKDDYLILCFRGTSSGTDALVDTRFLKTDAFGGRGRVHRGFNKALDSVWTRLQAAVDAMGPQKKLFVCGHSLGAALAQLAAHRLALGGYPIGGVYVYGSPRIGNREFMEAYNELLEEKTFLHINHSDIVARIPPRILGFNHLGGSPRLFDEGHAISFMEKSRGLLDEEEVETDFEALDEAEQQAILRELEEARQSLEASTSFLTAAPELTEEDSSRGLLDIGPVNDHSMDLYLFKLGCAVVDEEWRRMEGGGAGRGPE